MVCPSVAFQSASPEISTVSGTTFYKDGHVFEGHCHGKTGTNTPRDIRVWNGSSLLGVLFLFHGIGEGRASKEEETQNRSFCTRIGNGVDLVDKLVKRRRRKELEHALFLHLQRIFIFYGLCIPTRCVSLPPLRSSSHSLTSTGRLCGGSVFFFSPRESGFCEPGE